MTDSHEARDFATSIQNASKTSNADSLQIDKLSLLYPDERGTGLAPPPLALWVGLSRYASSRAPRLVPVGHQPLTLQSTPTSFQTSSFPLPGQPAAWHTPGSQVPALDPRP